jgi:hypothetical protein
MVARAGHWHGVGPQAACGVLRGERTAPELHAPAGPGRGGRDGLDLAVADARILDYARTLDIWNCDEWKTTAEEYEAMKHQPDGAG